MKHCFLFVCILALLFSLTACSTALETPLSDPLLTQEETTETKPAQTDSIQPMDYPKGFSVGYSRVDITPQVPIHTYDGAIATTVHDPIQMTCVAMCDGENVFLLYGLDLRGIPTDVAKYSANLLEKKLGIPQERIFLNCTHTHTSPDTTDEPDVLQWRKIFLQQLPVAAEEALRDLSPAKAFSGISHTEDVTFVRRYRLANQTYKTNPKEEDRPIAHESEADTEMRTVRFVREGKKDVLMVNYQTHYGAISKLFPNAVSADFVHWLREDVEKDLNCHFIYIQGAAGNLNFNSALAGERIYPTVLDAVPALVEDVKNAVQSEKEIQTGTIRSTMVNFETPTWNAETNQTGKSITIPFRAVGFGDLGFVAAPYEMFDMHGIYIREYSPYQTTFISAYTGGRNSYVPHAEGYEHGGYETQVANFPPGSGEIFADQLVQMLKECKEKE